MGQRIGESPKLGSLPVAAAAGGCDQRQKRQKRQQQVAVTGGSGRKTPGDVKNGVCSPVRVSGIPLC